MRQVLLEKCHDGIESFDVPHLEDQILLVGQLHHALGLLRCRRNRFFHEHVKVVFGQGRVNIEMLVSGHDDACGSNVLCEAMQVIKCACSVLRGNVFGSARILVVDANKFCALEFSVNARMMASQRADSDNAHFEFISHVRKRRPVQHVGAPRPRDSIPLRQPCR